MEAHAQEPRGLLREGVLAQEPEHRLAALEQARGESVDPGVARTLGVAPDALIELGDAGLTRPVRFVARKSMFAQDLVRSFYNEVSALAPALE